MTKGVQDLMFAVERVRDAFHAAIYASLDVDAALALVTDNCVLKNSPTGSGADGVEELRHYLGEDVLPHLPADLEFRRISRTGDRWRVAQEDMACFTHDRELPWLLPGVAPTGRRAEVLAVSVTVVRRSLVEAHRTLWDLTSLAEQLDIDLPARRSIRG